MARSNSVLLTLGAGTVLLLRAAASAGQAPTAGFEPAPTDTTKEPAPPASEAPPTAPPTRLPGTPRTYGIGRSSRARRWSTSRDEGHLIWVKARRLPSTPWMGCLPTLRRSRPAVLVKVHPTTRHTLTLSERVR